LVSKLIHEKGDDLSTEEIHANSVLLLHAGHTTTANLLTNVLWTIEEQGYYAAVRDGDVALDRAIEEVLRFRSPVKMIPRTAREDAEVRGEKIPEGSPIIAWLASANRDEAVFDDPDEFRPERNPNKHIAFGTGIHYCIGAPLATLEATVLFSEFVDRVESVDFSMAEVEPFFGGTTYGLKRFPITVTTA